MSAAVADQAAAALAPPLEKAVTIYIGGVHVAQGPTLIKTLLGSCIAVCLWDPVTCVGGMNHFMLPHGAVSGDGDDATRFGVHAMDVLIGAIMKLGGDRRRCVAKIFGGAHVLNVKETKDGVPRQNIEFIRAFLMAEGLPIESEDVGGYLPRQVHFYIQTGRVKVKRVSREQTQWRLAIQERQRRSVAPTYGDVTLFG